MEEKSSPNEKKNDTRMRRNYPLIDLDTSLEVARVAMEMRGKATIKEIEFGINKKGGTLLQRIASARQWGLIRGQGNIDATPIAKKILSPIREGESEEGKKEAYMQVKLFKELYDQFSWELPRRDMFANYLVRDKQLKKSDAEKIVKIIYDARNKLFAEGEIGEEEPDEDGGDEGVPREDFGSRRKISLASTEPFLIFQGLFEMKIICLTSEDKEEIRKILDSLETLSSGKARSVYSGVRSMKTDLELLATVEKSVLWKLLQKKVSNLIEDYKKELGIETPLHNPGVALDSNHESEPIGGPTK